MKLSRPLRSIAALVALCSLLFMQLAVAAYACPVLTVAAATSDCARMDMEQPALCHAHAQPGHQSLDKPDIPQVSPFVAADLTVTLLPATTVASPLQELPTDLLLTRATAPPLAIRHCCFRI